MSGEHAKTGNCWEPGVIYDCEECGDELCDVCHAHDMPRGECDVCPQCAPCDKLDPAESGSD
jgi:hypothetical protein